MFQTASGAGAGIFPALLLAAAFLYTLNTGFVATIMALVSEEGIQTLWQNWCVWSFPYYLVGTVFVAALAVPALRGEWRSVVCVLPMFGLCYICYAICLRNARERVAI